MALPTIGTLWIGPELSWLEQLCLKSFLDHGHEVVLFTYDKVEGVPKGVKVESASDLLPSEKIIRHAKTGSPAYHADIFRLHMLKDTGMIWADTDAFCVQPWEVRKGAHFHGWISDEKPLVNNGVLGLPKKSKTLAAMLKFTADEYPIPPWFSKAKRAELEELKDKGEGVHVSLLPWGVLGPNALTHFLKETGEIEHSYPGHVLYPIPFATAGMPLNKNRINKAKGLIKDDTLSIHFWGRRFRNIAAKYNGMPEEGTYAAELLARHKIDPKKTAHLMQSTKATKTESELEIPTKPDLSMFDDGDVANMVLQRSEIAKANQQIQDWINGDDASLLAFANANREVILNEMFEIARRECEFFISALDAISPKSVADIGCGYAIVDLLLYNRYKCDLVLIDIEESKDRHFGFKEEGSGYANLGKARAFLEKNGVPKKKITTINPNKKDVSKLGQVDAAISLASCGFHYPVSSYAEFFEKHVSETGGVILDIRKGSGGIGAMKPFGATDVLAKHAKYSTVIARRGAVHG